MFIVPFYTNNWKNSSVDTCITNQQCVIIDIFFLFYELENFFEINCNINRNLRSIHIRP